MNTAKNNKTWITVSNCSDMTISNKGSIMTSRIPFYFMIALCISVGITLIFLRHENYGVSLFPTETREIWDVEALLQFTATGEPVKVSLAAPLTQKGYTLIGESASSPGYGLSYVETDIGRRVEWSVRSAQGAQTLYYKVQFLADDQAKVQLDSPQDIAITPMKLEGPQEAAAKALIKKAQDHSADTESFTRELLKLLNDATNQNASLLLDNMQKYQAANILLSYAQIMNKVVGVVVLEDGRRRQMIQPMLQIWSNDQWLLFNPVNGEGVHDDHLLIWDQSNVSLFDVTGGNDSQVTFSMIKQQIAPRSATQQKASADNLLNLSIHSLPLEEQAMFKNILLIPIGALIVVFLRVIVGLKTSGTFMPILIAVAFVQTELVTGVTGFLLIVGTGLIIRGWLSKLNLLLVARISAVIISVILIISTFTIIAFNMGLKEGLTITFFPMIILSWTIERMSILWEEEGAKEVLIQGGGSLLTAMLVYMVMTNPMIRHLTFNFIGIQFIVLALILVLGNYTGYRLTELRRFKPLVEK